MSKSPVPSFALPETANVPEVMFVVPVCVLASPEKVSVPAEFKLPAPETVPENTVREPSKSAEESVSVKSTLCEAELITTRAGSSGITGTSGSGIIGSSGSGRSGSGATLVATPKIVSALFSVEKSHKVSS